MECTVHVVEDDAAARNAFRFLIESVGHRVRTYESAADFLNRYEPTKPECLVLDVRMPGMSGLELQEALRADQLRLPVIVVTAYGDVPTAVRAMRAGAVDLVEKPLNDEVLFQRIEQCINQDSRVEQESASRRVARKRLKLLTPRERQVMTLLVEGKRTKAVAAQLGISVRTAERHRAEVMKKLQAGSLSDVVRLSLAGA